MKGATGAKRQTYNSAIVLQYFMRQANISYPFSSASTPSVRIFTYVYPGGQENFKIELL